MSRDVSLYLSDIWDVVTHYLLTVRVEVAALHSTLEPP